MTKMQKVFLGSLIAVVLVAGLAWKAVTPRVLAGVREILLSQVNSSINGRIEMEDVDFSVLGAAVMKKVNLFDQRGILIATSDEIGISYKFSDLFGGRFGIDGIKKISVEKANAKLTIDKDGKWSFQDIIKPRTERKAEFLGSIEVKDVAVSVTTPNWKRNFTEISGELDYADFPTIAVELKGKMGKSSITAQGSWIPDGKTQLALMINTFDLSEAQALLPGGAASPKLTAGTLNEVQGTVIQERDGVQMTGEGKLMGLAMNLQGMEIKEGAAKLKMQGKKVLLQDASVVVGGNKLTVGGAIDFTPDSPVLAMQVLSPALNLAAFFGPTPAISGTASFQADISGTMEKPLMKGAFKVPIGQFDKTPIVDAEGGFNYAGDTMMLDNTSFKAMGGEIALSGTVAPKTARVNLKVAGKNVDGVILTNKGIVGSVDFNATVTGEGNADSMATSGTFSIGSGVIGEYAIANAAGGFRKQGRRVDLSNVGVVLSGQRLVVNGALTLAADGASPQINLQVSSNGMSTTVFNPNSALRGSIAFQATLTGTPESNQARGNFQIASGELGELAFSGASGGFGYVNGLLTLVGGRAQCLGGIITLNGTVVPKTMEYHQQVNGQNIDAAQLTDRDVQGRADFAAKISGVGDWDKSSADGDFKMSSGNVKGIPFNGLTGNFSKRGRQTEFRNLKFNMLGGLASGTGETEGEYVRLIITPNTAANTILNVLTGKTLQPQDLRIRFRGPNG